MAIKFKNARSVRSRKNSENKVKLVHNLRKMMKIVYKREQIEM